MKLLGWVLLVLGTPYPVLTFLDWLESLAAKSEFSTDGLTLGVSLALLCLGFGIKDWKKLNAKR